MPTYDDPPLFYDDPAVFYADEEADDLNPLPVTTPSLGTTTAMEYWEIIKERAQQTLAVWNLHLPAFKLGPTDAAAFEALIDQFEPLAQERTTAQDSFDEKARNRATVLLKMKILGTKVPQIIDGQVSENAGIIEDLADVYRVVPRSEPTILGRARALHPVWVRANAALAALVPPGAPITRVIQGVPQTTAMLKTMLDTFTDVTDEENDSEAALNRKRGELRVLSRKVDQIAKKWYQVVKSMYDEGSAVHDALSQIPVESGTPAPDPIELNPLEQGGEDGLHVLVSYEPGGGDRATTRAVEWMVEGVDADFTHSVPLDASGNALGPFAVDQVVKVRTKVSNSSGARTSAVRTITIEEPI